MPKESLDVSESLEMVKHVARKIIEAEPILTDADRNLGDGDHGIGMQRGMTAVLEKLESESFSDIGSIFNATGMAMMSSMGGASGALFGTLFRSGAKNLAEKPVFDSLSLSEFIVSANEGVQARGGASPGDKTMIDALDPAANESLKSKELPIGKALEAVACAAESGRDQSKGMIATMGRAKTLGEKSVGHPDAGACSIAIIFRAMAEFANN
ncbi:dihydroxyacetone kinase subunit DhaL [Verrucomicrobiales bacterium]|nr:dihydroxyacetone kinase subunit DhaL [Verrucomicrobiales bacterium]MDB4737288.1 dihydroxyacetone kinase subunit DhaL [Verrucomicrobiales bacterium]